MKIKNFINDYKDITIQTVKILIGMVLMIAAIIFAVFAIRTTIINCENQAIDNYVQTEMIEHLDNPALFN